MKLYYIPRPPNVPLFKGLMVSIRWYLGSLKGSWGVLVYNLQETYKTVGSGWLGCRSLGAACQEALRGGLAADACCISVPFLSTMFFLYYLNQPELTIL